MIFAYDIMSADKEKLLFHSEHKQNPRKCRILSGVFIPIFIWKA